MMKTLLAIVSGIVVFGFVGLVLIGWVDKPNPPTSVAIMHRDVTIAPGTIEYYNFSVPENASDAFVRGEFEAAGGAGNDIVVCLATRIEFKNSENGHPAQCLYYPDKVTAGRSKRAASSWRLHARL